MIVLVVKQIAKVNVQAFILYVIYYGKQGTKVHPVWTLSERVAASSILLFTQSLSQCINQQSLNSKAALER